LRRVWGQTLPFSLFGQRRVWGQTLPFSLFGQRRSLQTRAPLWSWALAKLSSSLPRLPWIHSACAVAYDVRPSHWVPNPGSGKFVTPLQICRGPTSPRGNALWVIMRALPAWCCRMVHAMLARRRPQGNMTHRISPEARSACPERGVSRVERGARTRGRQLNDALPKKRSRPDAAARVRQNRASGMHCRHRRQPIRHRANNGHNSVTNGVNHSELHSQQHAGHAVIVLLSGEEHRWQGHGPTTRRLH